MPPRRNPADKAVEDTKAPVEESVAEEVATEETAAPEIPAGETAAVDEVAEVAPPAEEIAPETDQSPAEPAAEAAEEEPVADAPSADHPKGRQAIQDSLEEMGKESYEKRIAEIPEGKEKELVKSIAAEVFGSDEPIVKSGARKVRVRKFFGSFLDAVFMEDKANEWGEADKVSAETLAALRTEYPGAEIEEVE